MTLKPSKGINMEEDPKQKKLEEMKEQYLRQKEEEMKRADTEKQLQSMLRKFMDEEARQRLSNVRLVNQELYSKAIQAIMSMAQRGYLTEKLNEEQLKAVLGQLKNEREISIKRK